MTKTVLITGTSSGYGKAMADLFLERGWNVLAAMRKPDPSVFDHASERLKIIALDVTDRNSIDSAIAEGLSHFGAIDVLINNAGIGFASAVEVTPDHRIQEIFDTNTFGVFAMCRAIIPVMRKQGAGTIINITSSATIGPMPLVAVYAASKCAVEGFSESLSYELYPFGINVRLVEPGYAPTTQFTANGGARMEGMLPADYGAFTQAYFTIMGSYPTGYCSEAEVADATYSAATDETRRLRYPAGPDSKLLAHLRWSTSDEEYIGKMREMFDPISRM